MGAKAGVEKNALLWEPREKPPCLGENLRPPAPTPQQFPCTAEPRVRSSELRPQGCQGSSPEGDAVSGRTDAGDVGVGGRVPASLEGQREKGERNQMECPGGQSMPTSGEIGVEGLGRQGPHRTLLGGSVPPPQS